MNDLKTIEVRHNDGTPVKHKLANGFETSLKFDDWHGDFLWSWLGGERDAVNKFVASLPTYHRGKLKGELQANKHQDTLIISHEYYVKLISNSENKGAIRIGNKYHTFQQWHFPELPALYIYIKDVPNVMGLYEWIEKDYCDSRHAVHSFSCLQAQHEKYLAFKKFRESLSWELSFEKCGYQDEQTSVSIKIDGDWHYLTRFQNWELNYWSKLFTPKTKTIHLAPNIIKTIEANEKINETFLNKHLAMKQD